MSKFPRNSFERVYYKFSTPLIKFIAKRLKAEPQVVEDVFSRTIAAAWKSFNTFEYKSSYFTWLCKIALNKIADYYREQIHHESVIVAPFLEEISQYHSEELSPEEKFALAELRASVRASIKILPAEKRQLIYLRYWKNLTLKEIAKIFNTSERAIEGKIYRSKRLLKEILNLKHPELSRIYNRSKN